jgi:hypothetical protein
MSPKRIHAMGCPLLRFKKYWYEIDTFNDLHSHAGGIFARPNDKQGIKVNIMGQLIVKGSVLEK